jgi:hypothetical protein
MEQLKRIVQVGRRHYEKLILVLVLLLLAAGVWYLYGASQAEREKTQKMTQGYKTRAGAPIQPVDLSRFDKMMKVTTNPPALNYAGKHNLFNPVKWQQPRAGAPILKVVSGTEIGANAMRIVSVNPLLLSIAFDRAATSGADADAVVTGYHIVVTNDLILRPRNPRVVQYVPIGATNTQVFVLTEVKGPSNAPTEFVAQLKDFNNEAITFAPGKPYTRVVGYETELSYPPSGRRYPRLRKDSPLDIEGEPYKVVDITANKVVVSDDSNGKRYIIEQMVAP